MSEASQYAQTRELLVKLVGIPSITGEERACAEQLVTFFEAHDREAWIDEMGNVRAPADDGVLLTSHIDTVPGDIPVKVESRPTAEVGWGGSDEPDAGELEVLWGRGSVDAKGCLASMAVVAVRTGASFLGVVGEEVDSRGSRHVIETRESEPDAVINGEPSGWDGVTLGYRGILSGTYVATSESGHTSRPDPNAIQDALDWWSRVEERFDHDPYEPTFEQVTAKPVQVEGGTSEDGLSVEATLDVQLRVPPSMTVDEVPPLVDNPTKCEKCSTREYCMPAETATLEPHRAEGTGWEDQI